MNSIIPLIRENFIKDLNKKLGTSTVVALQRKQKIVSGKTAKSVRVESKRTEESIESNVYGSAGMKFIIEGKKANTKFPVRKVGNKFELVPSTLR